MTDPSPLQPWEGSAAAIEQGRHWSSTLIWISAAVLGSGVAWAFTARMDQTISVRGQLQPAGSVREVDSPSTGVVSEVLIKDGDSVVKGQPLLRVEAEGLTSRKKAVNTTMALLQAQNRSLQQLMSSQGRGVKLSVPTIASLPAGMEPALAQKVTIALQQANQILARLQQIDNRLASQRETLALNKRIESDMRPLYESGGIARIQYLNQRNLLQEQSSQIASLQEERAGVIGSIAGQINQNNRELESLRAEREQLSESLRYRTVLAPIDGKVFDLQAKPAGVVSTSNVILKLVPSNKLEANVSIPNSDIGFVRTGLLVSVAVDSFPAGEFGYINGVLESIGSDALPPDQEFPFSRFPGVVSLKQQQVEYNGKQLNLQSGMAITANIKLRSRPVIHIISDLFTRQVEGVKRFR